MIDAWLNLNAAYQTYTPVNGSTYFLDTLHRPSSAQEIAGAAQQLAQSLAEFDTPAQRLRLLEFQTDLVKTAQTSSLFRQEDSNKTALSELLEAGREYAALAPGDASTSDPLHFFLDTLYRQPGATAQAATELDAFVRPRLQGETRVKELMTYSQNLLRSLNTSQDATLIAQRQDPAFIQAYLELGGTYASLEPRGGADDVDLEFFLDTLYQNDDDWSARTGAKQLATFLKEAENPEKRIKLLEFSENLLLATKNAPSLSAQRHDPQFVEALLGLGGAYAAFNPVNTPESGATSQNLELFLDTLYKVSDGQPIQNGANQLSTFLENFGSVADQIDMLKFEKNLFTTLRLTSEDFREDLHQPLKINDVFNTGILYAVLESAIETDFNDPDVSSSNEWFSYVWNAKSERDLKVAANYVGDYVAYSQAYASTEPIISTTSPTSIFVSQFMPAPPPTVTPTVPPTGPTSPVTPGPFWRFLPFLFVPGMPLNPLPLGTDDTQDWKKKIDPITKKPYQSENEFLVVELAKPPQIKELSRTKVNKGRLRYLRIDPEDRCIYGKIPRLGGNRRHNNYAKYITGEEADFYILTPEGRGITYDGNPGTTNRVWEVKAPKKDEKGTWLYNAMSRPDSDVGKRAEKAILYLTQQMTNQRDIALHCEFDYKYATASEGLTKFLNKIWAGGGVTVQYLKYPDNSYLTNEGDEIEFTEDRS